MQGANVVEHEAQEARLAAAQGVDGVVDGDVPGLVLTDHQEGCVAGVGQNGGVREVAHRGRIHDHVVKISAQDLEDLAHPGRAEEARGVVPHIGREQAEEIVRLAVLHGADEGVGVELLLEQAVQIPALAVAHAEDGALRGLAQVAVHQKDLLVAVSQAQGEVRGDGGLALVFRNAGDDEGLAAVVLIGVLDLGLELADRLHVGEGRGGVGDQQGVLLFLFGEQAFQPAALVLVPDRDQELAVHLIARADRGLDRLREDAEQRQNADHDQRPDGHGDHHEPALLGPEGPVVRDIRGVDRFQHDGIEDQRRPLPVVPHDAGGHIIGGARRRAGAGQTDDAGVFHGLGGDGNAVDRIPEFLRDLLAEHGALEQGAELIGSACGDRIAGGSRVLRGDDEGGAAGIAGLHQQRCRDIDGKRKGDSREHDHPEIFQDDPQDAGGLDLPPERVAAVFFCHDARLPYCTMTVRIAVAVSPEPPR